MTATSFTSSSTRKARSIVTVGVWARGGTSDCHLPLADELIAPSNLVTKPALFARQTPPRLLLRGAALFLP